MFGYDPELEDKYKNCNVTSNMTEISDTAIKNLAKLFIELAAKYNIK